MLRERVLPILAGLLLAGCGGAAGGPPRAPGEKSVEPGAAPSPQQAPPAAGQPGYAPPPAATAAPTAPKFAEPPGEAFGPERGDGSRALDQAVDDFDRAATELAAAASDCSRACKALGSMRRASDRICSLDPGKAAGGRCRRARERVTSAEARVRERCSC